MSILFGILLVFWLFLCHRTEFFIASGSIIKPVTIHWHLKTDLFAWYTVMYSLFFSLPEGNEHAWLLQRLNVVIVAFGCQILAQPFCIWWMAPLRTGFFFNGLSSIEWWTSPMALTFFEPFWNDLCLMTVSPDDCRWRRSLKFNINFVLCHLWIFLRSTNGCNKNNQKNINWPSQVFHLWNGRGEEGEDALSPLQTMTVM